MQNAKLLQRRTLVKLLAALPLVVSMDTFSVVEKNENDAFICCVAEALIPGALKIQPSKLLKDLVKVGWLGLTENSIAVVKHSLDSFKGNKYSELTLAQQRAVLSEFDECCYNSPDKLESQHWLLLKNGLLSLYFSSEIGASGTLSYHPVPGQWRPDISIAEATPAMYNDWLAVWFT
ncbi:gluconate 2-dehydrogenase subunit 3 family protein [Aestuariibacter sp. GS-14]|uniref:gluconate 2-dehydrogenase subunit 3 family protein n=1 Tax=Aestuariibacter sp. GS-14 TaxID=2590670 RepID=UPI001129FE65|nr:gluconate 2-dehydrogenase subunit 3 family protein [Aestuariibacter sp. GS-14]TPV61794.1 gluconate 2-dehydrogenase subunit 3 family protein [Aestuariibacter sp. GS-14]